MTEAVTQTTISPAVKTRAAGLALQMGGGAVLIFAVASISLATSGLAPFSILAGLFPGANLPLLITVAMGLCLLIAYTYAVIGAAVRLNAADYILTSRILPPGLAFAFSWILVIFNALLIGVVLARAAQVTLPVFMRSIAVVGNVPGMLLSANYIASPQGIALVGSIAVGLAFLLSILPPRTNQRFIQLGFILLLVSWIAILFMLLLPSADFPLSWDRFMGDGTFAAQLGAAQAAGMQLDFSPQTMLISGLLAAMWIFYGFQTPVYIAGEIKRAGRSLLVGSLGAVLISWLVIAGSAVLLQRIVSPEWISAQSFLALHGQPAQPWLNFYAAIAHPNPFLITFISLAWLFSMLNMAQAFFIFTSRIIHAWTEDGLLPAAAAYIHPELKSPIIAILIVAVIAQFGVWIVALGDASIAHNLYFVFFAACIQIPPMIAVILAPFTRKAWFASAGRLANLRLGPLPLVSLTGFLSLVCFAAILGFGVSTPALMPTAINTFILILVLLAFGLLYFFFRRRIARADTDPFQSFPPPAD